MKDEVAAEIFAPVPNPDDETDLPEDSDDPNEPIEPPITSPETPSDEEGDNNTPSTEETPTTPPAVPETPTEQPSEEEGDNTPNGEEPPATPPAAPETPSDGMDDDGEDYIPPISHWPVQRPQRPIVSDPPETEPEDEAEPEPEQAPVEPETDPTPALMCGNAGIDTSRSVVLHGYGDGLLHLEDGLTRAQLATIVFRLLDEESIARYDTGASAFADVDSGAWCYRYVNTIAAAGIVYGVGEGNYNPDGLVTWAQALTILSRFVDPVDYELQEIVYSGWALQSVQTAVALGWIEDTVGFNPEAVISRGELVELFNRVLALNRQSIEN